MLPQLIFFFLLNAIDLFNVYKIIVWYSNFFKKKEKKVKVFKINTNWNVLVQLCSIRQDHHFNFSPSLINVLQTLFVVRLEKVLFKKKKKGLRGYMFYISLVLFLNEDNIYFNFIYIYTHIEFRTYLNLNFLFENKRLC